MNSRIQVLLAQFSWALYDFANTIYSMNVVTMYFSLWITVNLAREDLWVSAGNSISMALVAISLPILGAYSDFLGKRLQFLFLYTLLCVLATAGIGFAGISIAPGVSQVIAAVLLFIVANYAYQGALVFYNALLPFVSTPRTMGRISGIGVGLGYLGSITGLLLVMPFVQGEISFLKIDFPGFQKPWQEIVRLDTQREPIPAAYLDTTATANDNYQYRLLIPADESPRYYAIASKDTVITGAAGEKKRAVVLQMGRDLPVNFRGASIERRVSGFGRIGSFFPTAILFFLLALPIFLFVRESRENSRKQAPPTLLEVFHDIWESISNTRRYPGVLRFLIAKFFYEEGIQTAIIFMAVYAVKVMGFSNEVIIPFFMITTTAAAIGSTVFGFVTDSLGSKRTLLFVIGGWVVCLVAIVLVQQQIWFWIIGSIVGIFMGSTWTAARPLLVQLVPRDKLAEFFGLYSFSGKAAAIFGPLIWGGVVAALAPYGDAVRYRGAVLSLALLMLIGFLLLLKIPATSAAQPDPAGSEKANDLRK